MLNIQLATEIINHYHRNKGILKKLRRTEHPAIRATETYLKSLKIHKGLLSNQDLFKINRFFLYDYPVKPGKASYRAWAAINYQNFCALNYGQITRLSQLLNHSVPIKYSGFATCNKAGYQQFPEHFSELTLERLDNKSNAKKMHEFFLLLSKIYSQIKLNDNGMQEINLGDESDQDIIFNEDHFLGLSKLCIEGMLTQAYIDAVLQSRHANFLVKSLIYLKHNDTLSVENQQFIIANAEEFIIANAEDSIISVTHSLVTLDKAGLNTLANREILAKFNFPIPLLRTIKSLEKNGCLTQKNFDFISAEKNMAWLCALEEMPEELITSEIWQGLVNLSINSNENDFRKDIQAYAEVLKKKLNVEQIEKAILASEEHIETQATNSNTRFFSVTPVNLSPLAEMPKVNFTP